MIFAGREDLFFYERGQRARSREQRAASSEPVSREQSRKRDRDRERERERERARESKEQRAERGERRELRERERERETLSFSRQGSPSCASNCKLSFGNGMTKQKSVKRSALFFSERRGGTQ